ncbi:Dps family protein [Paucilactobacillus wasatchensis]|uniref:Ferroxidase n=1 Tax=Paucilactobacillus wasatchensis TaxID=1335616 RepID=A0A0D0YYI3_9LACO|nr:Dps family protein [Paucilactobacillus wasatchensis]KIS04289.1 Ferroxidase [Paucilactobacillus wasatchensis]
MSEIQFPQTQAHLNQLIADLSQIQVNVQQVHWYMRGPEFFKLHPKMDEFNDQFAEQLDEVAERLIALGGKPYATTHEFIEHTKLPDEIVEWGQYKLPDFMQNLDYQFKYLRDQYQLGIEITDGEQDFPTQDMLNGFKAEMDKLIWMVSAFLDKSPLDQ